MKMKWSPEQTQFLKDNYPIYGSRFCRERLNLKQPQIRKKVARLGLSKIIKEGHKICPKCLENKPFSDYSISRRQASGLSCRCKTCCKLASEKYRTKNPEKTRLCRLKSQKKYHNKNQNNLQYRISKRLRSRIYYALRGSAKFQPTFDLLGCSYEDFVLEFKNKMTPDMTWDDVLSGKIHIDHIKPCSSFDLSSPEQQKICFHHTNLQPLWEKDNINKGDRIV